MFDAIQNGGTVFENRYSQLLSVHNSETLVSNLTI